jgi:hypothetical protein
LACYPDSWIEIRDICGALAKCDRIWDLWGIAIAFGLVVDCDRVWFGGNCDRFLVFVEVRSRLVFGECDRVWGIWWECAIAFWVLWGYAIAFGVMGSAIAVWFLWNCDRFWFDGSAIAVLV